MFSEPLREMVSGADEFNAFDGVSDGDIELAWTAAIDYIKDVQPLVTGGMAILLPYYLLQDRWHYTNKHSIAGEVVWEHDSLRNPNTQLKVLTLPPRVRRLLHDETSREYLSHVLAQLDQTSATLLRPLAMARPTRDALEFAYGLNALLPETRLRAFAAAALLREDVPGVQSVPLDVVVALRRDEEAFHTWRRSFNEVIARAHTTDFQSEAQVRSEIRNAIEDILVPERRKLEKAVRASNVLSDLVVPSGVAVGIGGIIGAFSGSEWSVLSSGLSAAATFFLRYMHRRMSSADKSARRLHEFYGFILE
jgi:hypothetical protein